MESRTFAAAAVTRAAASFGVYVGLAIAALPVAAGVIALLGVFPEIRSFGFEHVFLGGWAVITAILCVDFRAHLLKLIELYGDPDIEPAEGDDDDEG